MGFRSPFVVVVWLAGSYPAAAGEPASKDTEPNARITLEAYGKHNAGCAEWSDGCAVCARQNNTEIACSLPGIACQPKELACQRETAAGEAPKK